MSAMFGTCVRPSLGGLTEALTATRRAEGAKRRVLAKTTSSTAPRCSRNKCTSSTMSSLSRSQIADPFRVRASNFSGYIRLIVRRLTVVTIQGDCSSEYLTARQSLSVSPVISRQTSPGLPLALGLLNCLNRPFQSRARSPHKACHQPCFHELTLVGAM
jgi:hypothetical protein